MNRTRLPVSIPLIAVASSLTSGEDKDPFVVLQPPAAGPRITPCLRKMIEDAGIVSRFTRSLRPWSSSPGPAMKGKS
jgi:hypothetical protein